jgi:hypothetical protein
VNEHEDSSTGASRRRLLAGGAAVVGSAAGAVLLGATDAQAADGNAILAGRANTATAATTLTNSSTSGGAHGLLISTKGGYGFQASSASNHGLAGITANATKAGVLATHNGPRGSGAALVANGRNNMGASVYNTNTDQPTLLVRSTWADPTGRMGTAIEARTNADNGVSVLASATGRHAVGLLAIGETKAASISASVFVVEDEVAPNSHATPVGLSASAGVWVQRPNGEIIFSPTTAIEADADVEVIGNVWMSRGIQKIDHPSDPGNQYLYHFYLSSDENGSVYNGSVVAGANGEAVVQLPDWFEGLNGNFRYQLTPIGGPAPDLHVKQEIAGNKFTIAGAKANQKVSWQVVGTRKDTFATEHRIPVEQKKPEGERGTYLFPRGFGQPDTKRLHYREPHKITTQTGE